MPHRFRDDVLLFIGLVLSIRCGGRMIDESIIGPDAGDRSSTFSSATGRAATAGPTTSGSTTSGPTTTGFSTTTSDTTSSATTTTSTSTSTGFGGGPTTTTVSTATTTTGFDGAGGFGGASSGAGGSGGAPQILCTSAPIPGSDQQVNCRKPVGAPAWECACVRQGMARYCTGKGPMPCGSSNCCGFDTSAATGCAATPVTLPPISGCVGLIRGGYLGCAHVDQLNNPGYGPFTSCCPPSAPFSCPTGTPGTCFATADQARANCKDYCVQCVPTMF